MNKKGIALAAVILLITFVAVAVLGATSFIAQRLVGVEVKQRDMRCRYNAQAGLHYAIYQYRNSGTNFSGTVTIDDSNSAVVSTAAGNGAGNLIIDARASVLASGSRNVEGVFITNASSSTSIIIDRMILNWSGANNRNLERIRIDGSNVWTGSSGRPANVDITNFTLNPGATYSVDRFRWSGGMSGRTITLQCVMTDGSTTSTCTIFPAQPSVCSTTPTTLTINSMGKTAGSGLYRTVQATYTTATGNISDYKEVTTTVP